MTPKCEVCGHYSHGECYAEAFVLGGVVLGGLIGMGLAILQNKLLSARSLREQHEILGTTDRFDEIMRSLDESYSRLGDEA